MASFTYYGGGCVCSRDKCSDDCKTYRNYKPKPATNADKIRAMTDEAFAKWIVSKAPRCCPYTVCRHIDDKTPCSKCWLDWLRQEA